MTAPPPPPPSQPPPTPPPPSTGGSWWSRLKGWQKKGLLVLIVLIVVAGVASSDDEQDQVADNSPSTSATESTSPQETTTVPEAPAVEDDLDAAQQQLDQERSLVEDARTERDGLAAAVAELQGLLDDAEANRETVESELASAVDDLTVAELRITALADKNESLSGDLEEERRARAVADANAENLALAYEPERAATRSALLKEIDDVICGFHEGIEPSETLIHQTISLIIEGSPEYSIAFQGYDLDVVFDLTALAETVSDCQKDELLTAPKGSGFYTVGDEIAPGKWRSTGTGGGCYWARLDENQNIRDNHFGNAGGVVTIRVSDYEVEFGDCGEWEYLG